MKIVRHKRFVKKYKKLSSKKKIATDKAIDIFVVNQFDKKLHNHSVDPPYTHCSSINVTGDLRAIFYIIGNNVIFIDVDTHSNLYG